MADKFGAGIIQGSTSVSVPIELWTANTFAPPSTIGFASAVAGYWRQGGALVTIACVSLTAPNSAWTSGGWVRLATVYWASNMYRLDVPDAAFVSGADWVAVIAGGPTVTTIDWTQVFPLIGISDSAVQVSLSSLTVAVASALVYEASIVAAIPTRASASLWTAALASRIDASISSAVSAPSLALTAAGMATLTANVDTTVSSRASASLWTSTVAGRIDANVSAAVSAPSLALTAFDPLTKTQGNALAASLALTAYAPLTTVHADALAASAALTAYAPLTTAHGDALAASIALAAYTGVSTALTAYGVATLVANVDTTITSRASASLWTSTVANRIDDAITSRASASVWTASLGIALAALGNAGVPKNVALANFEFLMVDATDGMTAKTGLAVTATRSIDGAAFGACANAVSEVGSGIYKIDLAAADLNGTVITLRFASATALDRFLTVKTTS